MLVLKVLMHPLRTFKPGPNQIQSRDKANVFSYSILHCFMVTFLVLVTVSFQSKHSVFRLVAE